MKFEEYSNDFDRYLLTERRVSQNTFDAYKRDIAQFHDFIKRHQYNINVISIKELKEFLKELRSQSLSVASVSRKISCLKTFFNHLEEKYGFKNHAEHLTLPKLDKKLPHFLSENLIEQLFIHAEKGTTDNERRNYVMLLLLYATGMRISELTQLSISSIDFEIGSIRIKGKGSKDRIIPIPNETQSLLRNYLQTLYPVFLNKSKQKLNDVLFPSFYDGKLKPMSRQSFWNYIKDLARKAGVSESLSPHQIRHSLATHLLHKGAHLRSIQLLLGHENLKTVQIYTHIETSHLRKIYDAKHPRS